MSADFLSGSAGDQPANLGEASPHFESAPAHLRAALKIDPRIAQIAELFDSLAADIINAQRGQLGISSTGLVGDADLNLTALVQFSHRSEAMYTVAGSRADADGESWQGLRTLLRANGKAHAAELSGSMHAGALVLDHPAVASAWVGGEVTGPQVRFIAKTARRITNDKRADAVSILLEYAPQLSMRELTHASRVMLNAIIPGLEERDFDREQTQSYFVLRPDGLGYVAQGRFTVEQAGWLQTVLDSHTSVVSTDETRSRSERQADALVMIARQYAESEVIPTLAMARPRFVVLATLADLRCIAADEVPSDLATTVFGDTLDPFTTRRMLSDADVVPVVVDGESQQTVADIALDPLAASRVRAKARFFKHRRSRNTNIEEPSSKKPSNKKPSAEVPMLLRLLTTPVRPLALGRSNRVVPGWMRDLITLRDAQCVVPGCEVPAHRCEVHHVQPWALGGLTDEENLAMLCVRHHRTVERGVWRLRPRAAGDGPGRYWVAEQHRAWC